MVDIIANSTFSNFSKMEDIFAVFNLFLTEYDDICCWKFSSISDLIKMVDIIANSTRFQF